MLDGEYIGQMRSSSRAEVLTVTRSSEIDPLAKGSVHATSDGRCLTLQGWVVGHSSPVTEIEIADETGGVIARAPVNMSRPDLAEAFESASMVAAAGFRVVLEPSGAGEAHLAIRVVSSVEPSPLLAVVQVEVVQAPNRARRPLRQLLSRIGARKRRVSWSALSVSGESEKVLVGRDGWLFLRRDTNDVLGQHTGQVQLDQDEQLAWRRVLAQRQAFAEERGAVWLCVVIPDKESLYPEYLPSAIRPAPMRPVHDFLEMAKRANAPVVYALPNLEREKPRWQLYPKTDTHWDHRGAYVVYRMICEQLLDKGIEIKILDGDSIRWSEDNVPGDLGGKVYPDPVSSPMLRADLSEHSGRLVFDNGVRNHGRVMIFERTDRDGPTCVVFGESFAERLLIFLKETFGRLVVVHTSMFISEVVENEHPDVVLSLPLERFLIRVPDDNDGLARLRETARRKEGQLPWPA